jgi:NADPH2:quinone reductase
MTGKAYYLVSHGNASSSFELRSFQVASPMDHEVLIKVEAFGLNFADVMARRGKYRDAPSLPFVPGYDVVGRIYKVGNHVNQDLLGKRVAAFCRFGGYSNWIVTPTNAIVVIDDLPAGIALALCTQGVTAQYMAAHCTHLTEDDYVLIHAAAGGVGSLLIQLLKNQKVKVIAKVGSDEKAKVVRELGADFVINYRENDYLWGRMHGADRLIDIVCDAAGVDSSGIDIIAFKARAFSAILDAEEPHLSNVPELFKLIREDIRTLRDES